MIAATLHGPNYWAPSYDFDTIEVFDSLEQVIEALFDRYSSNGRRHCDAKFLDGHTTSTLYPGFDPGTSFTCYLVGGMLVGKPTEEQAMDAHTAVHGGWKDYTVTLAESDEGTLRVIVERAGI